MAKQYIYNERCGCKRCAARRGQTGPVINADYQPETLADLLANERLEEQDRDASRARFKGGRKSVGHSFDSEGSPLAEPVEVLGGGERFESERYGSPPRLATPADILDAAG